VRAEGGEGVSVHLIEPAGLLHSLNQNNSRSLPRPHVGRSLAPVQIAELYCGLMMLHLDPREPKAACALITAGGTSGTGFLISPERMLTCHHVVKAADGGSISVTFSHGQYQAGVEGVDVENDSALLRLTRAVPSSKAEPLLLTLAPLLKGTDWEGYGFPMATQHAGLLIGGRVQDPTGEDSKLRATVVLQSVNVTAGSLIHGFSGSPVLVDGKVVGQMRQIIPDSSGGAQMAIIYACPTTVLARLARRSFGEIPFLFQANLTLDTTEQQYVDRLQKHLLELSLTRSFVNQTLSTQPDISLAVNTILDRSDGRITTGITSLPIKFSAQSITHRKDSDFSSISPNIREGKKIENVSDYILSMRKGWVIQLLGEAGGGKSHILREVATTWAEKYHQKSLIPFYLELRDVPQQKDSGINYIFDFIAQTVSKIGRINYFSASEMLANALSKGRAVVIFDAIDELENPISTIRDIVAFMRKADYINNRYVFSCRIYNQISGLRAEELLLLPIEKVQLIKYFRRILASSPILPELLRKIQHPNYEQLLNTPLVATAYARYVIEQQRLPISLYETLEYIMLQKFQFKRTERTPDDNEETIEWQNTIIICRRILGCIARCMLDKLSIAKEAIPVQANFDAKTLDTAIELSKQAGILYEPTPGFVAFALHRYKELFLVEEWERWCSEHNQWPEDLLMRIGRYRWSSTILFLGAMTKHITPLLTELDQRYTTVSNNPIITQNLLQRSWYLETINLYGRLASIANNRDSSICNLHYVKALQILFQIVQHPDLLPNERIRILSSLSVHKSREAGDSMLDLMSTSLLNIGFSDEIRLHFANRVLTSLALDSALTENQCMKWFEHPKAELTVAKKTAREILSATLVGRKLLTHLRQRPIKNFFSLFKVPSFKKLIEFIGGAILTTLIAFLGILIFSFTVGFISWAIEKLRAPWILYTIGCTIGCYTIFWFLREILRYFSAQHKLAQITRRIQEQVDQKGGANSEDIAFVVNNLLRPTPDDLPVIRARLRALEPYIVADSEIYNKILVYAQSANSAAVQYVLWEFVDKVNRNYVLKTEILEVAASRDQSTPSQ